MISSPTLSRRAKAAILASPPRALRLDMDARLAARRVERRQAESDRVYREREQREIHAALSRDIIIASAALLSACSPQPNDEAAALHRAQVITVCPDGTLIGQDPKTHRLLWSRWNADGFVKAGITADRICQK